MAWMVWLWEKWGVSKIWNRGEEGRKYLQSNPVILKTQLGSNMADDYLS